MEQLNGQSPRFQSRDDRAADTRRTSGLDRTADERGPAYGKTAPNSAELERAQRQLQSGNWMLMIRGDWAFAEGAILGGGASTLEMPGTMDESPAN